MHKVNNVIAESIKDVSDTIYVLLSSGMDSKSVLFECIKQGKKVEAISFRLDGVFSTDFNDAKNTCDIFGIKHHELVLSTDKSKLISDIREIKGMGGNKKTDIECFFPFLNLYKEFGSDLCYISGLGADGHFCTSKKGMIHYKNNPDEYRKLLFTFPEEDRGYSQMKLHIKASENHIMPYQSVDMINLFKGLCWDSINKPIHKAPIISAYISYFKKCKVFKHANLQMGDSGIQSLFNSLLEISEYRKYKTVTSLYNRL